MSNQGFTLIEFVISMTIIIVISAFAVPGVIDYQAYQNEEQFVNQTLSTFRSYQLKSISQDNFTNFSLGSNGISFCDGVGSSSCQNLASEVEIFPSNLNSLNTKYYIDKYGNTFKNETSLIDASELDLETENFRIMVTKYGGVYKVKK
jgi:prepilin-type N-terminal cleavage/methylation domain-containing protein